MQRAKKETIVSLTNMWHLFTVVSEITWIGSLFLSGNYCAHKLA